MRNVPRHALIYPRTLVCVALSLLLLGPLDADGAESKAYSMGIVPQFEARVLQQTWAPILDEVENLSGIRLIFRGAKDIPTFENRFTEGAYDFAYMNPYHLIVANKQQGYRPVIRDAGRQLYGLIVVRNDSAIRRVEDLDGKTIAFPAPNALGAALIPRAEFTRKFGIAFTPRYVKSHPSAYLNVITGATSAGGGVQKTFNQQPESVRNALRVIHKTAKVAPHPIAAHPRVPVKVVAKIIKAFLAMGATRQGEAMLRKIPIKKVGKASLADYEPLKAMGLEDFYVSD